MKITKVKTKFKNEDKRLFLVVYEHTLEMYGITILISFSQKNIDKWVEFFNRVKDPTTQAFCVDYLNTNNELVMFFKNNPNSNTIAHECTHATDFILERLSYKPLLENGDVSEINAYMTGHLVETVYKARKRYRNALNKLDMEKRYELERKARLKNKKGIIK